MKKLFSMLFAVVVMLMGTSQVDAAYQWIYTYQNGTQVYVDDLTAQRDGRNYASVNLAFNKGGHITTARYDVWFENDRIWLYGSRGEAKTVNYSNYSGYLKDWLANNGYLY